MRRRRGDGRDRHRATAARPVRDGWSWQPDLCPPPVGRRPIPPALAGLLRNGGILTMASAAALTLGSVTIPVYEIYKVGEEPRWLEGLDLLGAATGLRAAVVPHYDNAEGGNHDTRFCYMGERRLRILRAAAATRTRSSLASTATRARAGPRRAEPRRSRVSAGSPSGPAAGPRSYPAAARCASRLWHRRRVRWRPARPR